MSRSGNETAAFRPVKMNRETFVFSVEFDQGEALGGQDVFPSPTATGIEYTSIEQTRAAIPCNGVRIWTNPDERRMARADTANHLAIVDFWLSSDQQKNVAKLYPAESYQEYLDRRVALLRRYMARDGERVWWCICGEQDGGVVWPARLFNSRPEAYEYYRQCYFENDPSRYPNTNRKMADFIMMRGRYQVDFARDNIAIQVSRCFSTHYPYEWGARLVWCERTGTLGSGQIAAAFMRGAARQYGAYWGMDISGWGGCIDGACFYDSDGRQISGLSGSLILRELIAYFYSGANFTHLESTASSCWIKTPSGGWELSEFGRKAQMFGKHALAKHPDRGSPLTPCAIMLEHDHGWDPRDHRIWGGCLEYGPGDLMIDDLFNFLFPGQEDNCCFAGDLDDRDYKARLAAGRSDAPATDWRPLEKGVLAASRFGDCFDVVLENCPLEVLLQYKILIITGALQLTADLQEKLARYAAAGGEVVLNIKHYARISADFAGFQTTGKIASYPKFHTAWGNVWDEGPMVVEAAELRVGAEACIEARRGNQPAVPAVVRHAMGEGAIYTTMAHYARKGIGKPMAAHCQDLLAHLIRPHLPVEVAGLPIQYLITARPQRLTVILINNQAASWTGRIQPRNDTLRFTKATDIWTETNLALTSPLSLDVTCGAFDFRVIEFITSGQI